MKKTPEEMMRAVVDACTDCDCCRFIMDTNCLFFPEIYKLWDREKETGEKITPKELRHLADLCNYCALCPCPNIREDIITAKTLFIDRDGIKNDERLLAAVEAELVGAGVAHSGLPREQVRALFDSDITLNAQGLAIWLKRRARRAFGRAAAEYDRVAVLQRETAQRMLERLDYIRHEPAVILDVVAGTGEATLALSRRFIISIGTRLP